jgi:hypothetical protein
MGAGVMGRFRLHDDRRVSRFLPYHLPPECRLLRLQNDNLVFTRLNVGGKELQMCPNCFNTIAMALGGAGSAVLLSLGTRRALAGAGLRLRTTRAPKTAQSDLEETAS